MTQTVTISNNSSLPTQVASAGDIATLFANISSNDTIYLSYSPSFTPNTPNVVTLQPGAFVVISPPANLYASCSLLNTQMEIIPGGQSYAAPGSVVVNLSGINQSTLGTYQVTEPSGFTGSIPASNADSTIFVATTTALTALSKTWTINAKDAQPNTVYEFIVAGYGTNSSSSNAGSWNVEVGGSGSVISLGFTAIAASKTFNFLLHLYLHITANGVTGNMDAYGDFSLIASGGTTIYDGTVADYGNTFNFNNNLAVVFNWQWATATGGPSATGAHSQFNRLGA